MKYDLLIIAIAMSCAAQADPGGRGCYGGRYSYGCGGGSRSRQQNSERGGMQSRQEDSERGGPQSGQEDSERRGQMEEPRQDSPQSFENRGGPRGFASRGLRNGGRDQNHIGEDVVNQAVEFLNKAYDRTKNPRFQEEAILLQRSKRIFDLDHKTSTCAAGGIAFAEPQFQSMTFCHPGRPPVAIVLHEGAHLTRKNVQMGFNTPAAVHPLGGMYHPFQECDAEAIAHEALSLSNSGGGHAYQCLTCPDRLADFPAWAQRYRNGQIGVCPAGRSRDSRH